MPLVRIEDAHKILEMEFGKYNRAGVFQGWWGENGTRYVNQRDIENARKYIMKRRREQKRMVKRLVG